MDIQFVFDVYACVIYIVSYISNACAEAREGNTSIKQQVRDMGNTFLNSVEITAQESVHIILQLPIKKCSREVVLIPTSPPAKRVQLLKPQREIEKCQMNVKKYILAVF